MIEWSTGQPSGVATGTTWVRGKPGRKLMVILRAPGCIYARRTGGCTNCGFDFLTTGGERVPTERLARQLGRALEIYAGYQNGIEQLDLFCSGSFLADDEIQPAARQQLLEMAVSQLPALRLVVVESRPEFVTDESLQPLCAALGDVGLELAIGLESIDDTVRLERIRKGFSREQFEDAAAVVARAGASLAVYLLLKPMGLTDDEAIADVVASGRYLVALGQRLDLPIRICLEPTFVPEGTPLHEALRQGRYTPPSLWTVVRATLGLAELLPVQVGLSSEGLPTEAMPTACHRCSGMLRAALARFNATQDKNALVRLSCTCQAHEEQSP
jgi:radical SAM enzyme (TIGR01210 family)